MLSQADADTLLSMKQRLIDRVGAISLPPGRDESHELIGEDHRERFLLDLARGRRRVTKLKFQTRAHKVVVLARLDINGSPHTNPDGQRPTGTHVHLYREGYDDRWAQPLPAGPVTHVSSVAGAFGDFCRLCRVVDAPPISEALW